MTSTNEELLKSVEALLDSAYDKAQSFLDEAFVKVDSLVDLLRNTITEKEPVDPDKEWRMKMLDVIRQRKHEGRQHSVWSSYIERGVVPGESDRGYLDSCWRNEVPVENRTWAEKS